MQGEVCRACPDAIKNWILTTLAVLFGVSLIGAQMWITLRGAGVRSVFCSHRTLPVLSREHGHPQDESKIAPMMIKMLLSHLQIAGLCAGTCA